MKDKLRELFFPNYMRGHAVMLSSFITGNVYFILLTAGFSAAAGLLAGIITAPVGFLAGAATIYIIRKAVNLEFKGLRKESNKHGITLKDLPKIEEGDLLETSKELYLDKSSWKAVIVSLAKFPIGLASLIFITLYLSLSISLITSPLIYKSVNLQIHENIINTPMELVLAVIAGVAVYTIGANTTEKASKLYLKLNSVI